MNTTFSRLRLAPMTRLAVSPLLLVAVLVGAGCSSDSTTMPTDNGTRMHNQVQRLGNPLVSEVFLPKPSHHPQGNTRQAPAAR